MSSSVYFSPQAEHRLLPHGASFPGEDQVPYLAHTDYLDIPFLGYLKHVGYSFLI